MLVESLSPSSSLPPSLSLLSVVRHGSLSMSKSCRLVFCRFFVVVFVCFVVVVVVELRFDDCLVINPNNNQLLLLLLFAVVLLTLMRGLMHLKHNSSSAHTLLGLFNDLASKHFGS